MELFSEIYSTYYRTVEVLLKRASSSPLSSDEMRKILEANSFAESAFHILPKLLNKDWPLLEEEGGLFSPKLKLPGEMPLSSLQKSWLKTILNDPKISLFFDNELLKEFEAELKGAELLYDLKDFHFFDEAKDRDTYEDELYRKHFRQLLAAIKERVALRIEYESGKGKRLAGIFVPYKLEYSSKDDKFRLLSYRLTGERNRDYLLNVGRMTKISVYERTVKIRSKVLKKRSKKRELVFEITRERNALDRCMIHFAHFEKRTEYDSKTDRYTCTLYYDPTDESELIIRMLSFGPTIKVLAPEPFIEEIYKRVSAQNDLI